MKLKTVEIAGKTYAELQDGHPAYEMEDGKVVGHDAPATRSTITRLNGEAKSHRERAEAAETKLKGFDGIEDPEVARKALATVKNLDDKKLIEAGEVDKVVKATSEGFEEKLKAAGKREKALSDELGTVKKQNLDLVIGGAFNRSKFIGEKMAIPVDLAQARFGDRFNVENGKVVATDASGNKVYSRSKPGELADFDEALEILVDAYPYRDSILKGSGASGGGAGGSGGGSGGKKTMTRDQFEALNPAERMSTLKGGTQVVD